MLDLRLIREDKDKVIKLVAKKGNDVTNEVNKIYELDLKRRDITFLVEGLKNKQNVVSKEIPKLKKEGKDVSSILNEMKELSEKIKEMDSSLNEIDEELKFNLLRIPNIPNETAPVSLNEEDNKEVRKWGEIREFNFEPKAHWDIGKDLNILDPERAAKVTGSRFTFYKGLGSRLERAVINFYLDTHSDNGYTEIFPPYMVNRASLTGTGQLPKFEEDVFKISNDDYFLIPTAEVPVTNLYRDEILDGNMLPIKHAAYSACFRSEAGSAGRDTRGLIRQHQFNKVELVKFTKPEDSYYELEKLTKDAEYVLQLLKLPYRVVDIVTGDLGFTAAKKYDIEVYMPSYNKYVEISSCSNFEDFQARRANIKFKDELNKKARYCHTLNGSGVAVGRTVAAILENYQNEDGSVTIPDVLVPYMGGITKITL
ncbi:MAG: serine--tRNA ligase [Ruminococcaceae bacterium]|nr:serine--tRNA ligase [Oscillospiraceae bacterium]